MQEILFKHLTLQPIKAAVCCQQPIHGHYFRIVYLNLAPPIASTVATHEDFYTSFSRPKPFQLDSPKSNIPHGEQAFLRTRSPYETSTL